MITKENKSVVFINRSMWSSSAANAIQQINTAHALSVQGIIVEYIIPTTERIGVEDVLVRYGLKENDCFFVKLIKVPRYSVLTYRYFIIKCMIILLFHFFSRTKKVLITRESILIIFAKMISYQTFFEVHDLGETSGERFKRSLNAQKRTRRAIRISDGIITVTKSGAREIEKVCGIKMQQILVAPDAAQLRDFEKLPQLTYDSETIHLMYTGSLWKDRGIETIVHALPYLIIDMAIDLIVVGGNAAQIESLRALATSLGVDSYIKFIGYLPYYQIFDWLIRAHILILPMQKNEWSDKYASPMKLFEYMSSRKPIIAADVRSIREIVNENHVTFYDVEDPLSLADAIKQVCEDLKGAEKRAINAWDLFKNNYTYNNRASLIHIFIDKTISHDVKMR